MTEPRQRRLTTAERAARRRRASAWYRSPGVHVLVLAGLAALVAVMVADWRASRTRLTFVAVPGSTPRLELTIYPDQLSFAAPSPPPALAHIELAGALTTVLDEPEVPGRAVVRYRGAGVGAGVVYVELGKELAPIELGPPRTVRGRVIEPLGFWSFGWRCAGVRPVAGAEVIAMAGGELGLPLATTQSAADGRFELTGIGFDVHPLSLRVRAPGHVIAHVDVPSATAETDASPVIVPIQRTSVLRGVISAPPDVDVQSLWLLARGLPGVQVHPAADGSFVLDHIAPGLEPRLLVFGLGPMHACREVRGRRGSEAQLAVQPAGVITGTVVDGVSGELLAGAHVFTADGAAAQTDANGAFELTQVLPGKVALTAQYKPPRQPRQRRKPGRIGRDVVEVVAGQTVTDIRVQVVVME